MSDAILLPSGPPDLRLNCVKSALEQMGYTCRVLAEVSYHEMALIDLAYAQQPNDDVCKFLDLCQRSGVNTMIDVTAPVAADSVIAKTAEKSSLVTYPELIPYAWDDNNPEWYAQPEKRETFNVGLYGAVTVPVIDFVMETPDARLIIKDDHKLYREVTPLLPEGKRLFLPPMADDMTGWLNSYFDVIAVNGRLFSDRQIMEAAVRGAPWLSTEFYATWGNAGGLVMPVDQWRDELRRLRDSPASRVMLGSLGKEHAQGRTSRGLIDYLVRLYTQVLQVEAAHV